MPTTCSLLPATPTRQRIIYLRLKGATVSGCINLICTSICRKRIYTYVCVLVHRRDLYQFFVCMCTTYYITNQKRTNTLEGEIGYCCNEFHRSNLGQMPRNLFSCQRALWPVARELRPGPGGLRRLRSSRDDARGPWPFCAPFGGGA